ncbi:hypothetical protein FH972_021081 [Carpinus fangiana]|uniref:Uncharacterized protein n=1 Tax=Carpinus fangiana TaxID=176857 RepID=A0A5N6KNB2_9ROSI|nr:hypothetical protein FH972_021081 [Carpinus fangiana]
MSKLREAMTYDASTTSLPEGEMDIAPTASSTRNDPSRSKVGLLKGDSITLLMRLISKNP